MKRRDAIKTIVAGAAAPNLLSAKTPPKNDIKDAIEALLRETEELWNAQDTAGLRRLWDQSDPDPYYLAGEQENWFIGWDALNNYLAPKGRPVTEAIRVKFYDIHARLLGPDLAFAAYWMRTDMKVVFSPNPFGSDNRVSAVFRRTQEGWRYLCYMEGFQAPNMYIQKLFEKDVSPDYADFYESLKKND